MQEFSKQSATYDETNIIQKQVATHLLSKITCKPKRILDLGCGTGNINKEINWKYDKFIGVDSAQGMCEKHPKNNLISVVHRNFEDLDFQEEILRDAPFDLVISSSALQWAGNIEELIKFSSKLSKNIAFAIFTRNTFADIYRLSGLKTFLPNVNELAMITKKYFDIEYEVKKYRLDFEDNLSKFRYIKKSGVSGGRQKLTVSQTKKLIKNYPHDYLEFEVIFIYNKKYFTF